MPGDLDLTAALDDVPDAGVPCTADDLEVCVRVSGSGPRILLVGDSQAAMFVDALEALAHEHDFTLLTNIVRGCGWQAGLVQDASPRSRPPARITRDFYADVLPQLDVDAVMTVSLARAATRGQPR